MSRFGKQIITPDVRTPYPKTIKEAIEIIESVFKANKYDAGEQKRFLKIIGVKTQTEPDEVRKIIAEFDRSRMELFSK